MTKCKNALTLYVAILVLGLCGVSFAADLSLEQAIGVVETNLDLEAIDHQYIMFGTEVPLTAGAQIHPFRGMAELEGMSTEDPAVYAEFIRGVSISAAVARVAAVGPRAVRIRIKKTVRRPSKRSVDPST